MSQLDTHAILDAMVAAEREAAELVMHAHGVLAECKTGHRDVVTAYDRRVQALLVERLGAACPGARFFCEENDQQDDLHAEHLFIIDPIDGTMNFVRGLNHICISVAYRRAGVMEAAAVLNLSRDHLNRHGTMEAYLEAKLRIFDHLASGGLALVPAIAALHAAGIAHRDLKPSNVLLDASGAPVLADPCTALRGGTPAWAAPATISCLQPWASPPPNTTGWTASRHCWRILIWPGGRRRPSPPVTARPGRRFGHWASPGTGR